MTTGNVKYSRMKEVFNHIKGVELRDARGGKNGTFHFKMATSPEMRATEIDVLELSVRSYHGLKRGGYNTIGQVIEGVENGMELAKVRNLGAKSIREIMENMFLWYLSTMTPEQQEKYLIETALMNGHKFG